MYHAKMYGIFAYIFHLSEDPALTSLAKSDLIKAANKIFDQKPMEALSDLAKVRAMCAIAGVDGTPYLNATEAIACAIISNAQSLDEITQVRNKLGPYAKNAGIQIMMISREIGLKALIEDRAALLVKAAKE